MSDRLRKWWAAVRESRHLTRLMVYNWAVYPWRGFCGSSALHYDRSKYKTVEYLPKSIKCVVLPSYVLPIQAQAFDLSKRNRREQYHACLGVHLDVDGRQRMSRRLWWKQLLPSRTAVQYVWRTIGSSCCFYNRHDEMIHEIHADCCSLVQYWHCERAGNHSVFVPCRQLLITVASSVLFHRTVWANSSSFRLRKRNRCKHCHAYFRCALGG
jgi:hypothetical protein